MDRGRVFHIGAPEEREKTTIGTLWARTTGNLFLTVKQKKHGLGPVDQMRSAIRSTVETVVPVTTSADVPTRPADSAVPTVAAPPRAEIVLSNGRCIIVPLDAPAATLRRLLAAADDR